MSTKAIITQSHLTDIANAIIAKDGGSPMTPDQMATRISSIPTGSTTPEWMAFLPSNAPNIKAVLDADDTAYTNKVIVLFSVKDGDSLNVSGATEYALNGVVGSSTSSWTIPDNCGGFAYVIFRSNAAIVAASSTHSTKAIAYYSKGNRGATYGYASLITPSSANDAYLSVVVGSGERVNNAYTAYRSKCQISYLDGIDFSASNNFAFFFMGSNGPVIKCVLDMRGQTSTIDRPFASAMMTRGLPRIKAHQSVSFPDVTNFTNVASLATFDENGIVVGGLAYDINTCSNSGMTLTFNSEVRSHFTNTQWASIAECLRAKNWGISPS